MGAGLDTIFPALISAGPQLAIVSALLWLYRTREHVHATERDYMTKTRADLMAERATLIEESAQAIKYEQERRQADIEYLEGEIRKMRGELARAQRNFESERQKKQKAEDELMREKQRNATGEAAS